jgi:hypothetical protein
MSSGTGHVRVFSEVKKSHKARAKVKRKVQLGTIQAKTRSSKRDYTPVAWITNESNGEAMALSRNQKKTANIDYCAAAVDRSRRAIK